MKGRRIAIVSLMVVGLALAPPLGASPVSLNAAAAAATDLTAPTDITRTILVLSLLAIVPAFVVCCTSFLRIVIVLSMVRHAFGMPQTPPNIVLTSLALFMTLFLMGPTLSAVNENGLSPFLAGTATLEEAADGASGPLKEFMLRHVRERDLEAVYAIARAELPGRPADVELLKLVPAFMMSELRVAFTIGFVVLLPFLLIDLVVSSVLLSLGMMMVPPQTISLPIKVLMFVLIDGWSLILEGLMGSFG